VTNETREDKDPRRRSPMVSETMRIKL
jgi:hypothetical protein